MKPKHAGGRPTKYKPIYCRDVIDAGAQGLSLTAFAGIIGVARSSINEWKDAHPEFSEACNVAQAKRTLFLEKGMLSEIATGPMVTARRFALANAAPDEWRDKQEINHSGQIDTSSKEQRDAAIAAALRANR